MRIRSKKIVALIKVVMDIDEDHDDHWAELEYTEGADREWFQESWNNIGAELVWKRLPEGPGIYRVEGFMESSGDSDHDADNYEERFVVTDAARLGGVTLIDDLEVALRIKPMEGER